MTLNRLFLVMLAFVPATLLAVWLQAPPVHIFILSALAIVPLAKLIGDSTEELTTRTTPAIGGLLNATFGNAVELIIGIMALKAGLIEVVKASITGSIIGNLLFVLGTAIIVGGWHREKQTFNATAAKASGSALLLAASALVIPAVFFATETGVPGKSLETVSLVVSGLMILSYLASLLFSLHTHKHLYSEDPGLYEPRWSVWTSVTILLASTVTVAIISEFLVGSIEPLISTFGWTPLFVGAVIIAIVGNIAEHLSAIFIAAKNRMDLALQISIGSATQVILLVLPIMIFASVAFGTPMTLVFDALELVAIVLSVFVVHAVIEDGVSTWYEGVQLVMLYLIIAIAFYFHP